MDRCALFVDAGHLLAQGGSACLGTKERKEIRCNYPALIAALEDFVRGHCGLPVLRMYWYDGAPNRIATPEHQSIALLPRVKVRLGQLTRHGQKGVDALIYHDLITLARERAIATAYIVAGDEDLREGVVVAQQTGVMVILLGIQTSEQNQSPALVAEADEHYWIPNELLAGHLSRPSAASIPAAAAAPAAAATVPVTTLSTSPSVAVPGRGAEVRPAVDATQANSAGRELAAQWVSRATVADRERLRDALERGQLLPPDIDRWLLLQAQKTLGSLWDLPRLRPRLRDAFRTQVREALRS